MPRLALIALALSMGVAAASADLGSKPHPVAQAAADVVRDAVGADAAFLPAGLLKEPTGEDLASLLQHPNDEIVVVRLRGSEVLATLERSVAAYPMTSGSFLQISGFTVIFGDGKPTDARILEVRDSSGPIVATREYRVAMPAPLARGALGYLRIWDRTQIERNSGITMGEALKGKRGSERAARYVVRSS